MTDDVTCEYKDKCSGFPYSCHYCKHNGKAKKNYFEPINPLIPNEPYIPWWQPVW